LYLVRVFLSIKGNTYTFDLLHGMLPSKPCPTRMEYTIQLIHSQSGSTFSNLCAYMRFIRKFLYWTHTRPNINFVVGYLSQFLAESIDHHHLEVLRILKHLIGSPSTRIFLPHTQTRRSVSRYCFFLGSSLISWKSKKRQTLYRYFVEARCRTMALGYCEAQWLTYLLRDLGITHSIQYHYIVRLCILLHIHTTSKVADIFTKALAPHLFTEFHKKLECSTFTC
ncbi:hypothetical protein Lal_00021149, partial [Lupinus albus]